MMLAVVQATDKRLTAPRYQQHFLDSEQTSYTKHVLLVL